jgi:hypothetical protein
MLIVEKTAIKESFERFCLNPKPETRQDLQEALGLFTEEEKALATAMEGLVKQMDDIDLLGGRPSQFMRTLSNNFAEKRKRLERLLFD